MMHSVGIPGTEKIGKAIIAVLCSAVVTGLLHAASPFSDAAQKGGISDLQAGTHTTLVNPNATEEAKGLMRYLSAVYGDYVLSGHQASYTWSTAESELASIRLWTGETPAVRGFDFMDVINSWGAPHAREALKWAQTEGGILHLCWHWRLGGGGFYSSDKSFPAGDPETNATINADLKKLGDELQKFADAKIPVLWRPMHEPPGSWFWWHTAGADKYVRLWKHMYNYLVNERKLNNLIWVYSGADNSGYRDSNWYPGNDYVDIAGVDGYGANWQTYWDGLFTLSSNGRKMAAMTENKKFPPWSTSNPWLFTTCWNNEIFNSLSQTDFTNHYNHANTINLKDLPTAKDPVTGLPKTTWDKMLAPKVPVGPEGNQALNQLVSVSSVDESTHNGSYAVDGNMATRWSSAYRDGEWITVKLDSVRVINRVVLYWEVAYASEYQLQVSTDSLTWTTVHHELNGAGGEEEVSFVPVHARYVRLLGANRATEYGISLYEFEIYQYLGSTILQTEVTGRQAKINEVRWNDAHVFANLERAGVLEIRDLSGRIVARKQGIGPLRIDRSRLPAGMLIVEAKEGSKRSGRTFVNVK